jgi:hypothetical protein
MFLLKVGLAIVGVVVPICEWSFLVKLPVRLFLLLLRDYIEDY